jgi:hypothetical protein
MKSSIWASECISCRLVTINTEVKPYTRSASGSTVDWRKYSIADKPGKRFEDLVSILVSELTLDARDPKGKFLD